MPGASPPLVITATRRNIIECSFEKAIALSLGKKSGRFIHRAGCDVNWAERRTRAPRGYYELCWPALGSPILPTCGRLSCPQPHKEGRKKALGRCAFLPCPHFGGRGGGWGLSATKTPDALYRGPTCA